MLISRIWAVYFSATGTTRKTVEYIAGVIGQKMHLEVNIIDFTLPDARAEKFLFGAGDLVIFGMPVYAGRVPNLLLPFLTERIDGKGAIAVPVVLFGNRAYDDALIELKDILETGGFFTIAAGAFVGEHSFSRILAAGRPDAQDMHTADVLAEMAFNRLMNVDKVPEQILRIKGKESLRPYYVPRDKMGAPMSILKVKPKTNDSCTGCGICAKICPMGSINKEDMSSIEGVCIKCGACIKRCPQEAKYFDDKGYLYHMHELEEICAGRVEAEIF